MLDILVSVTEVVGNKCCWMTCIKFGRDLKIPVSGLEYQNLWVSKKSVSIKIFSFLNYFDKSLYRSILSW